MTCSNCHHTYPLTAFIAPRRVKLCSTCETCRAAVASTRIRRNEGRVRNYEIPYFRLDKSGLGCLACPLPKCVWEPGGGPVELCPLGVTL